LKASCHDYFHSMLSHDFLSPTAAADARLISAIYFAAASTPLLATPFSH
jgi:hypothetical protein